MRTAGAIGADRWCWLSGLPVLSARNTHLWTRSNIHALILEKHNINIKLTTLWDYLHRWGLSAQRPVKRERKQDKEKLEQWLNYDYQEIHKRANEEGAEIFFVTKQMYKM